MRRRNQFMLCELCNKDFPEDEILDFAGKKVCEDCQVESLSVPKTCNPMAVRSARNTRESLGQKGTAGLLPIQEKIYEYIKKEKRVPREKVAQAFDLSPKELETHFAVLRHCELARGFKDGNVIYLTTFEE